MLMLSAINQKGGGKIISAEQLRLQFSGDKDIPILCNMITCQTFSAQFKYKLSTRSKVLSIPL